MHPYIDPHGHKLKRGQIVNITEINKNMLNDEVEETTTQEQ